MSRIAAEIGCDKSTVSREIKRNGNLSGGYNAVGAQRSCEGRRRPIFDYPRKIHGVLQELVEQMLEQKLSPDQISKRLKFEKSKWSVSHETIYKWIYAIAPEYKVCLRWKSRRRQKRGGKYRRGLRRMPRKSINARPPGADSRSEAGHWERDLLEGLRGGPALLVLTDRTTRFTIMRKVENKNCEAVNAATAKALKGQVVHSLTNDNGVEFGNWKSLEARLGCGVFYCRPYASWERGTVENINGLIRQFFPKKTDFKAVGKAEIAEVERALNSRPKKTLGYRTPSEVHGEGLQKLVRSKAFYRRRSAIREEALFKQDMIRETGFYLNKIRENVALNN